jgi:exonuclease III
VGADVAVLTEAQLPREGLPDGWQAVRREEGIDPNRRWGTITAARNGFELRDITDGDAGRRGFDLKHTRPGTVTVTDVLRDGKRILTVVGLYALTTDRNGRKTGNGYASLLDILSDLRPLFESDRRKRLVLAGDLNLWPTDLPEALDRNFFDVVLETERSRWEPGYCCVCDSDLKCGHMWTHWNRSAPNKVQNLDYIFISKKLYMRLGEVTGGRRDFPDADALSDHAPVVAELRV